MKISIVPVDCWNGPATQLECIDTAVNLGFGLNTEWRLLNSSGSLVSSRNRGSLTLDQYNAWTGEDDHVCRCIAINAGLTPSDVPIIDELPVVIPDIEEQPEVVPTITPTPV